MNLSVTSLGMLSSVGHDVTTACASIRAGITRPRPLPYFRVLDEDAQDTEPLMGHPLEGFADGFILLGLWVRVALACLEDLQSHGGLPGPEDASFWRRTGLVVALPTWEAHRYLEVPPPWSGSDVMGALFLERLKTGTPWSFEPRHLAVLHRGHAGCAAALDRARRWIDDGLDRVVVLAVDSYLDTFTLEWLEQRRRLKTGERPVGLMPGEAGAAVLVESRGSAVRRGAPVQAWIRAVTTGQEPRHLFQDKPNTGEALANVTAACLDATVRGTPFSGDVVVDLNGEEWRAREWGHARVRLAPRLDGVSKWVLPATSLGDVGAASGAVGLCVAVRSLVRRYATGRRVLAVSSSEWGDVGAILVEGEE